ncbi:tetratricopeptide repeat protein [bacterium]|nr:tetratricopeptide repeat protein [bacterium]
MKKQKFSYLVICLGLFLVVTVFAESEQQTESKGIFLQAQETFKKAQGQSGEQKRMNMLKAAGQFEALVEEQGIENGYLYYNIGNAYHEAGEKGKAILYYLKAKRLIPGFTDLNYNLGIAREGIHVPEGKKIWWDDIKKGILFWHYLLDYDTRRIILICSFSFIWIFLTISIVLRSFLLRGGVILSLILSVLFGGSYLVSAYQIHFIKSGVITKQQSIVRKGPGKTYGKFYDQPLPGGTEFRIMETQGEWWKIKLQNDDELWIKSDEAGTI